MAGRLAPELGGSRAHLGALGVNYYWTNQWELGRVGLPLSEDDVRRVSLATLLGDVWRRYGGELLITETSHRDDARAGWVLEVATAAARLLEAGVPIGGVCLYPILGMPEWHEPELWTRMGLWDLIAAEGGLERVLHRPMLEALLQVRHLDGRHLGGSSGPPEAMAARA